ncbi:MAG: tol-pal system protein YbgF [Proteobacteria bacterium]|nr:tol-pal system protein YbgF [Pseudomonadota bacterium]MCL2308188.1 tol-pal system protein YbgF [Pseudomonadota bacterium]
MNRSLSVSRAALFALFFALLSSNASAFFDDKEARKNIEQTNVRLSQIEAQLNERVTALEQQKSTQAVLELSAQLDAIRSELAQLRGQIEVLTYELGEAKRRQRDLYADLDSRLARLESNPTSGQAAGGAVVDPAAVEPASPSDEAAEQRVYDAAMELFKRGDYAGAAAAFTAFTLAHPQSPLASSAQYWIGNARFAQRDYRAAVAAQTELLQKYPDSQKVPDAMLNLASAHTELGDRATARRILQDIIARFPGSDAANKARQRVR